MRRLLALATILIGLLAALTGIASATATTYTVTSTVGPFSGTAGPDDPGAVRSSGEAYSVTCRQNHDALLAGSAVINRTTSHGTTSKDVINLDRIGAFYDPDALVEIGWGTFIRPTGRAGWNSVTITATCLIRRTS